MKKLIPVLMLTFLTITTMAQKIEPRRWNEVDTLISQGLLQSAFDKVNAIYDESKRAGNGGEALKALLMRLQLEPEFQENAHATQVAFLTAEMEQARTPQQQILASLLAQLYSTYYNSNRWTIDQRTPGAGGGGIHTEGAITREVTPHGGQPSGSGPFELETGDRIQFRQSIHYYYLLSLTDAALLQSTPVDAYSDALEGDAKTRNLRPTLYDLLAFRAIDYFKEAVHSDPSGMRGFPWDQPALFGPVREFVTMPLTLQNKGVPGGEGSHAALFSPGIQALAIFQELLRFRVNGDVASLVDADLQRLNFVFDRSTLADRSDLCMRALQEMTSRYQDKPESAEILYTLARMMMEEGRNYKPLVSDEHKWDLKEALELAEKTATRFPDTRGGKNCLSLAGEIKFSFFNLSIPAEVVPGLPALMSVEYRNTPALHFRVVADEPSLEEIFSGNKPDIQEYSKETPLLAWSQSLPDDGDYQVHRTEVKLPPLAPGYYVVLVSREKDFAHPDIMQSFPLWSTHLSLVTRTTNGQQDQLWVVDRLSGEPRQGVTIRPYFRKYNPALRKQISVAGEPVVTGSDGTAQLKQPADKNLNAGYYVLTDKKEKFISAPFYRGYFPGNPPEKETRLLLFTDRSIYRPGQTIWFKGIALEKEGERQNIRTSFQVTLKLNDANGQMVASQELTTNDFGSFSGSFTTPKGVLTGQMAIVSDYGSVGVRVEEYKRPRFEVTFTPAEGNFQLGEKVTLQGKALNYAGIGVSEAQVTWRVVRNARFPFPVWRRQWLPVSPDTDIAYGTTLTGSDGGFSVSFEALADPAVDPSIPVVFTYTLYADVTDLNGETRSGEMTVSAAFKPLMVTTSLGEWVNGITDREVTITVTRPGGEPLPAAGSYTITPLKASAPFFFERRWPRPDRFTMSRTEFVKAFPGEVYDNEADASTWARGKAAVKGTFDTSREKGFTLPANLPAGNYELTLNARDTLGRAVAMTQTFHLFRPEEGKTAFTTPLTARLLTPESQPGGEVSLLLASPLEKALLFLEAESKGGTLLKKQVTLDRGQTIVRIPVGEGDRGDILISLVMVSHNRVFTESLRASVPYSNKKLELVAGSFRSALEPGAEEEWRITIRDHEGSPAVAELLATMYDASLEAFAPHGWPFSLYPSFPGTFHWQGSGFGNAPVMHHIIYHHPLPYIESEYERLPGWNFYGGMRSLKMGVMARDGGNIRIRGTRPLSSVASAQVVEEEAVFYNIDAEAAMNPLPVTVGYGRQSESGVTGGSGAPVSVPPVQPRKDFNETAFFIPRLATNAAGEVVLRFKMPESLTRWRMMALAHTRDLRTGTLDYSTVTRKELMLFPNPPRFLREGDRLHFPVKIANLSGRSLTGSAHITFLDAFTMQPVDHLMGVTSQVRPFQVEQGGSVALEWEITIPEGLEAVVYRVTATAGTLSDGEEAPLPVLTNRMLVTEALPLPIRGLETKTFRFDKLALSGQAGSTLRNFRLTFEYTSNPAWYAVQALPYLMEFPHECSEQVFSRFYANTLATYMAGSDPALRRVFDAWQALPGDSLRSQLDKNEELKAVLLQESPWVREATNESARRRQIALLFDAARMASEQNTSLKKLQELQSVNGGWPWFPGMPESEYITRHILAGLGRLNHRGVISSEQEPLLNEITGNAIHYLDQEMLSRFEKLKKEEKEYLKNNHFTSDVAHYFYARTFFTGSHPFPEELTGMVNYYRSQAAKFWTAASGYTKGMTALMAHRMGDGKLASAIMRSLKETALHSDEMGMYWRSQPRGWFWHEAPVETHALLTEAFDEVAGDARAVEELKVWLLKQKQTQDWKTTRATAEAVWALLMRGDNLLAPAQPVSVTAGGRQMNPALALGSTTEPGSGYFKVSREASDITPAMARIEVKNSNPGIAWGAAYWQYFEQLDHITPAQSPLHVSKQLFREVNGPQGPVLEALDGTHHLGVGDKVVVRVLLKSDRDMEYIHLKDMRASAFEPVNVLSGYRWQGGLGYYESTRDAASHFFISYLPKGSYVFEYRLHAVQKGEFSNGITTVQCMYAPEFAAHSEGTRVVVE